MQRIVLITGGAESCDGAATAYSSHVDLPDQQTNNRSRLDYPRYRRVGLPVTSAESLVKQVRKRVKATEKFWDDGATGEAILQVRPTSTTTRIYSRAATATAGRSVASTR
jgi:hypothetical protein